MTTKPIRLIIFDCDGVLIDSEVISAQTLIALLKDMGTAIDPAYVQRNFLGRSFPTVTSLLRQDFSLDLGPDFEADYRRKLLCEFEKHLRPTKGIADILKALSVRCCVATSSSPERVERSLGIAKLAEFFDGHVYTASEVANGKPAPDLFIHVAQKEGVDPADILVIEDSLPGIEAALAAGMRVVRYTGGSHFDGLRDTLETGEVEVPTFDSWPNFFDMIPALKKAPSERT